ncbi:MAG TPA: site-specific integrase [Virgibacillus sp.]|nr:site-specific integrase [Virgibacillus sp.]
MKGGVRKRYGSWYYYFDLGTVEGVRKKHERKAEGAETRSEALRILRKAITEYENTGRVFEPSKTSVHDYLDFWLKEYVEINLSPNTWSNYKSVIDNHIKPEIGSMRIRSVSPELLQKFINGKHREGFARKSLTIFHSVLNNALRQAVHPYKLIEDNPMQYVSVPRVERKKATKEDLKILTLPTIQKITNFLDESNTFYIPFHIGFGTGMRVSEVCGLMWEMVDLDKGTIEVNKAMVTDKEGQWYLGPPKNVSSYRKFKIGGSLIAILRKHKTWQNKNKLKYGEHYTDSDFVCTKENGEYTSPGSIKWSGRNLRDKLDIEFNFHSLRHTHATLLLERGAVIKDIQKKLGHARASITIDTYSHLTEKMQDETVDIFEGITNELNLD